MESSTVAPAPGSPGGPDPASSGGAFAGLDLAGYWRTVRKRWRLVALALVLVSAGVFVWTYRQPKIFASVCTLVIEPSAPRVLHGVTEVVEMGTGTFYANREFYETQYRIMASKDMSQRVVDRLALASDPNYPAPGAGQPGVRRDPKELAGALQGQTRITPIKDSRIAQITVEDRQPARAAQIANTLASVYIEHNLDHKLEGSNAAATFLGGQAVALGEKLKKADLAMYEYRKQKQILDVGLDDRQSMNTQNVRTYTQKLAELRVKKLELESARKLILAARDNVEDRESLPEVRQNPVVQQLRVMHVDLSRTLAELETTYAEKHPKVDALKSKLARVWKEYVSEIDKLLKSNDNMFRAVEENERSLNKLLEKERREAIDLAKLEVEYRPLAREVDDTQNLYKLITARQKETGLTGLIRSNNVRVLDPAVPGKAPVRPRLLFNMGLALLAGLALGIGAAFAMEVFDNTVKNQEEAEAVLGVPVLGLIPVIGEKASRKPSPDEQKQRDLGVFQDPKSSAAEACRSIRTNLLFMSPDRPLKAILVTSPGPQEGKTATAINLAITMSQAGTRVLLVDTDLRKPRIHRVFGTGNETGISNLIVGEGDLDRAIVRSSVPNLDILPCGPLPPNPAELLHTRQFANIMAECSRRYDRVIYDSPPTSAVTDPAVIGNLADGVVLIIRAGRTSREAAAHARRQLADAKARVLGAIVNRVDPSDRYYSYYYQGYYRRGGYYGQSGESAKA